VLYASASQVGAIVPFGLTGSSAQVIVTYQGQVSAPSSATAAAASPGVFLVAPGQLLAVNGDGSLNDANHPAPAGSYITMFATGVGQTNPTGQDGAIAAVPLPLPKFPVTVTIGGKDAFIQYSGAAPGQVQGITQVNAQIPSGLTAGANAMLLQVGGVNAQQGLSVYVK